jgi:GNAT superfamily N-acetyltransferase
MNSPTLLPEGVDFRPLTRADVPVVLEIIRQHDEDDYEFAKASYQQDIDGHYVLVIRGIVFGVTGGRYIEDTDETFALSWTYLHPDHQGQGLGKCMVQQIVEILREQGARKIFVNTSDYVSDRRVDIYRTAREVYASVGFQEELRHPHYFDRNETLIALGCRMRPPTIPGQSAVEFDERAAILTDVDEIPETDDAYYIAWEFTDEPGATEAEVAEMVRQVSKWKGRAIFIGIPSNAPKVASLFINSRFRAEGQLSDFYADGIHERHFRLDLS